MEDSIDKKIRILIVEDEYLIALSFKRELENIGYDVVEPVASGQAAVDAASQEHPDIILMDMGLAGTLNGIEAARSITNQHNIPIIFMTGHSDVGTLEKIKQLNPIACLIKPIVGKQIHQTIENYLQSKNQ
jgi:CheY-like chemotaxis protein